MTVPPCPEVIIDPWGPGSRFAHVRRGGARNREARYARAAIRGNAIPTYRDDPLGCRAARTLP
jgi:formylglycine-generating enzyme required for sulfatase activity